MLATPPASSESRGISDSGFLTDSWYLGATSRDLRRGQQFRRIILGQPVMLGRTEQGTPFALRDICPHRLVPLSAGRQVATDGIPTVECPYHGWRFGTDGVCKLMPSLTGHEGYDAARVSVRRYPVAEKNGMVFVYVSHTPRDTVERSVPPPDFGDLPEKPKFAVSRTVGVHVDDAIISLMDPDLEQFHHARTRHQTRLAGQKAEQEPLQTSDRGWTITRHQATPINVWADRLVLGRDVTVRTEFELPGYRLDVVNTARARLLTLTCVTPVSPGKTRLTVLTWWTGAPLLSLAKPLRYHAARMFIDRADAMMVERQDAARATEGGDARTAWYRSLKTAWSRDRSTRTPKVSPTEAKDTPLKR